MEKSSIIGWVIGGIFVVGIIASLLSNNKSDTNPTATTSQQSAPTVTTVTPEQNLDLQSKCATDGKSFVNTYELSNNSANGSGYRPVWGDAEYHYDTQNSTCLAYIWYTQKNYDVPVGNLGDANYSDNIYSSIYSFVFNIYSNKAVLQSVDDRTTTWGAGNTDTVSKYSIYQDIPNLDEATFNAQVKVLMSS
jgi:hypothetical protein